MTEKGLYVIALPKSIEVEGYSKLEKIGHNHATSPGHSIAQYLHRIAPDIAKKTLPKIREKGYTSHAMRLEYDYTFLDGEQLEGDDLVRAQLLEIAQFFDTVYGGDTINWIRKAESVYAAAIPRKQRRELLG